MIAMLYVQAALCCMLSAVCVLIAVLFISLAIQSYKRETDTAKRSRN